MEMLSVLRMKYFIKIKKKLTLNMRYFASDACTCQSRKLNTDGKIVKYSITVVVQVMST